MHEVDAIHDPQQLMLRCTSGDRDAFDTLYRLYFSPVFLYILKRVRHKELAEDIAQTVFAKAYHASDSFTGAGSGPLAYFFTIARNEVASYWRTHAKHDHHSELDAAQHIVDSSPDPHTATVHKEQHSELFDALALLPPQQQHVLILKFFHGFPTKEIARELGKEEAAIRQIQCRALKALRAQQHI